MPAEEVFINKIRSFGCGAASGSIRAVIFSAPQGFKKSRAH